jgi:hypothetical protein
MALGYPIPVIRLAASSNYGIDRIRRFAAAPNGASEFWRKNIQDGRSVTEKRFR